MLTALAPPPVFARTRDMPVLQNTVAAGMRSLPDVAAFLRRELERAHRVDDSELMTNFVKIGSWVMFRSEPAGRTHFFRIVLPEDGNLAKRRLSVLTPHGAALLGLQQDRSFAWRPSGGGERLVTALMIL